MFLQGIQNQHRKVKSVMTAGVKTVTEDTPARDIARLMCANNIKRVPVSARWQIGRQSTIARSDLQLRTPEAQKLAE